MERGPVVEDRKLARRERLRPARLRLLHHARLLLVVDWLLLGLLVVLRVLVLLLRHHPFHLQLLGLWVVLGGLVL